MSENLNPNNNDEDNSNNTDMLGVSVYWLKTGFLNEVKAFQKEKSRKKNKKYFDPKRLLHLRRRRRMSHHQSAESMKVYEIENLNGPPGVIRNKGKDVASPIDGKKGAAYVHCLEGEDNVGPATVMLSYTWGYTIGMIVDTLEDWCRAKGKDPKRTYVWICCLCVNQHRVVEQTELEKSGMVPSTPSVNFFDEFGNRVKSIGTILALMEPWESPKYLSRIWCVFEVYWATVHNCNVEIIMPKEQKELMTNSIVHNRDHDSKEKTGIDKLYDVLSNIDIEKADASVQADKDKILEMIRKDGGYTKLNNTVNELFRSWVRKTIDELVLQKSNEINMNNDKNGTTTISKKAKLDSYGELCYNVGEIYYHNGEYDESIVLYEKCLGIRLKSYGENHVNTADVHNNIGTVQADKGDYDNALIQYNKALTIQLSKLGKDHPDIATTYNNIGLVLKNKGDYDNALMQYEKARKIEKSNLGEDHPDAATTYNNIATVLIDKGDYDNALIQYNKALKIQLSNLGKDHPSVATTYNNIGLVLHKKGDYDNALIQYEKALTIRLSKLGKNHPSVAVTYSNIGSLLANKGDYDNALMQYEKARKIDKSNLGEDHPDIATTYNNIGLVLHKKSDYDNALIQYEKALTMQLSQLGEDHPAVGTSYNNIGSVLYNKADYENALIKLNRALDVCIKVFGEDHHETKEVLEWIEIVFEEKRKQ